MDLPDLDPDPLRQLAEWVESARTAGEPLPDALAISTVTPDGEPASRMVILRGLDSGLVFFTDRESDKGSELAAHPRAAALFHWLLPVHRQVRVSGPVTDAAGTEVDRYWASRPPAARRSAIASHQSRVVPDRAFLETAAADTEARHPDGSEIVRPGRWGGYRMTPDVIEFWEEGPDRLHDRIRYRRSGPGWEIERLSP